MPFGCRPGRVRLSRPSLEKVSCELAGRGGRRLHAYPERSRIFGRGINRIHDAAKGRRLSRAKARQCLRLDRKGTARHHVLVPVKKRTTRGTLPQIVLGLDSMTFERRDGRRKYVVVRSVDLRE